MNKHNEYHARLNINVSDAQIKRVLEYHNNDLNNLKINDIESYNKLLYTITNSVDFLTYPISILDDSLIRFFDDGVATNVGLCRILPNNFLSWHSHKFSNTANINIPLQIMNDSFTIYSDASNFEETAHSRPISKVDYQLNSAALLNTKKFHAVYNMSANTRYMLLLTVHEPVTYDDVLAYCKKNNLLFSKIE